MYYIWVSGTDYSADLTFIIFPVNWRFEDTLLQMWSIGYFYACWDKIFNNQI